MHEVLYSCDSNYISQTLVSAASLIEQCPDVHITIVADGFSLHDRDRVLKQFKAWGKGKNLRLLGVDQILPESELYTDWAHARTIYTKLFLERIYDGGKVLYLDSDTVVTGKLDELFSLDMQGKAAAAVCMPYPEAFKKRHGFAENMPFYCDGVVLIDVDRWTQEKLMDKSIQFIKKHEGAPPGQSEGTMNIICAGNILTLPPKYNLMSMMLFYKNSEIREMYGITDYYSEKEQGDAVSKPVIIHYIRELYNRPWCVPCDHPYKQYYLDYNQKLLEPQKQVCCDIGTRTRVTKILYRTLPFSVFCRLYRTKHHW